MNEDLLNRLADRALWGEGDDDLLDEQGTREALEELERAAAAVAIVGLELEEELPASLAKRCEAAWSDSSHEKSRGRAPDPAPALPLERGKPRWVAWLAAAACLVVALLAWLRPPKEKEVRVEVPVTVTAPPPKVPTLAEARAELLKDPATVTLPFSAPLSQGKVDEASKAASGDVVWNNAKQQGFMRIANLAANDPKAIQYQLWIFDAERDDKYPVDGGVFDVSSGELIVPIRAKLDVRKPALFAITVEKPGGVVVSKRERIVLVAKPG